MPQIRNTQQRQLVRDLLTNNHSHPTADEVYALARKKNPTISRGTVYRNLNILAESGEILRITTPSGPDRYDFITTQHYHFQCRKCGCIFDTGIPYEKDLLHDAAKLSGYKIEGHQVMLTGLCPKCNQQESANPSK